MCNTKSTHVRIMRGIVLWYCHISLVIYILLKLVSILVDALAHIVPDMDVRIGFKVSLLRIGLQL